MTEKDFIDKMREAYNLPIYSYDGIDESMMYIVAYNMESGLYLERINPITGGTIALGIGLQNNDGEGKYKRPLFSFYPEQNILDRDLPAIIMKMDKIIESEYKWIKTPERAESGNLTRKKLTVEDFLDKIIKAYDLSKTNEKDGTKFFENPRLHLFLELSRLKEVRFGVCKENPSKNPRYITKYIMFWSYYTISKTDDFTKVIEEIDSQLSLQEGINLIRKKNGRLHGKQKDTKEPEKEATSDVVVQPEEIKAIPKPPIGVMPRDIWEEKCRHQRITDIQDAMNRFVEAKKDIPYLWIAELDYLNNASRIFEEHTEANQQSYP